jgi:hypothetical protein
VDKSALASPDLTPVHKVGGVKMVGYGKATAHARRIGMLADMKS